MNRLREGLAAHQTGDLAAAVAHYQAILAAHPKQANALHLLGVALHQIGRNDEAISFLNQAVGIRPDSAEMRHHRGCARLAAGQHAAAIEDFEQVVAIAPDHAEARFNIGLASLILERMPSAVAALRRACALNPTDPNWRLKLAEALTLSGAPDEALSHLRDLLAAGQITPSVCFQFALAHVATYQAAAAESWYRRTIVMQPDAPQPRVNLAHFLAGLERRADAVLSAQTAALLAPSDPVIQYNLADFLLAAGDAEAGWALFAWRNAKPEAAIQRNGLPTAWTGETVSEGGLLLFQEQGVGDEILFAARFAEAAAAAAAPVIVECEPRLRPLFARSFPEIEFIDMLPRVPGPPTRIDFSELTSSRHLSAACPIGDISRWVTSDIARTRRVGYLKADPKAAAHWRAHLDQLDDNLKVGICWRSSLRNVEFADNYFPISALEPIFRLADVTTVNLLYDECEAELTAAEQAFGCEIHRPPGLDLRQDLDGVSALISQLDVVVSTTTSVLALAGALGRPVIALYPRVDWTFIGLDRPAWYPSAIPLIRGSDRPWRPVIEQAAGIVADMRKS